MINHYKILGLNSNGLDEEKNPYLPVTLNRAYRKMALKWHPDKNQSNDAINKFSQLTKSYVILSDPEKRADFDKELIENPSLLNTEDSLFFELDDDVTLFDDLPFDTNPEALIVRPITGINLTELIKNADCSPESLLTLAKTRPVFANALLGNASVLNCLSISQHFELLFIIEHYRQVDSDYQLGELSLKNEHIILGALKKNSPSYDTYVKEFVSCCLREKKSASAFLSTHQDILNDLTLNTLLALTQSIYEAVTPLITRHGAFLRISEIHFILNTYPTFRDDIVETFKSSGLNHMIEKVELSYALVDAVTQGDYSNIEVYQKSIDVLGMDALTLGVAAFQKKNKGINNYFYSMFLTLFIANKPANLFFKDLSDQDKSMLLNSIIHVFEYCQFLNSIRTSQNWTLPFLENIDVISRLMDDISFDDFADFIRNIPTITNEDLKNKYNDLILHRKLDDSHTSGLMLIKLLCDHFHSSYNFLVNNDRLLYSLLQEQECIDQLDNNDNLNRKLALWAAACDQPLDFTTLPNITSVFMAKYHAFKTFYRDYFESAEMRDISLTARITALLSNLTSPSQTTHDTNEPIQKQNISIPIFWDIFNETSYFPDLSLMKFPSLDTIKAGPSDPSYHDNIYIKFIILKSASFYQSKFKNLTHSQRYLLEQWFHEVYLSGTEHSDALLQLYQENYPTIVLDEINTINKWNLVNPFKYLKCLEYNAYWNKYHITGHMIHSYINHEISIDIITSKYGSLINSSGQSSYSVSFSIDVSEFKERIQQTTNVDEQRKIIDEFFIHFKECYREDYPNDGLSLYCDLNDSIIYKIKVTAYRDLIRRLNDIKMLAPSAANTDDHLICLLDSLTQCGLDKSTFSSIESALNCPDFMPLLSALSTILMESTDTYPYHVNLNQKISKYVMSNKDTKELCTRFFILAEHYVQKHHQTIHGDILEALYAAHGDRILPIITQYGQGIKLTNGKLLEKYATIIRDNTSVTFKHVAVDIEQITDEYLKRLDAFIATFFNTNITPIDDETFVEFHAQLFAFVSKNQISNSTLTIFLDTYNLVNSSSTTMDILLACLFEYSLQSNNRYAIQVKTIFNNELIFESTINALVNYLINHKHHTISLQTITSVFDESIAEHVYNVYLTTMYPELNFSEEDYACIKLLLYSNKLLLSDFDKLNSLQFKNVCKLKYYLSNSNYTKHIASDNNFLHLNSKTSTFFPLVDLCVTSTQFVQHFQYESPRNKLYYLICESYDVNTIHAKFVSTLTDANSFYESAYYTFLESTFLKSIHEEIQKLTIRGETNNVTTMLNYQAQIIDCMIETAHAELSQSNNYKSICKKIHTNLDHLLVTIINDPVLNTHQNPIKAFFMALAGVLLAACLIFFPLASREYRGFFFTPTVVHNLNKLHDSFAHDAITAEFT